VVSISRKERVASQVTGAQEKGVFVRRLRSSAYSSRKKENDSGLRRDGKAQSYVVRSDLPGQTAD
jgi:hypothetical protein